MGTPDCGVAQGPTPETKWRVHMLHNLRGRTMTVPLRIFEQFTELMVPVSPSQIIGIAGDGRCQSGAPGGMCKPARCDPGDNCCISRHSRHARLVHGGFALCAARDYRLPVEGNLPLSGNSCSEGGGAPGQLLRKQRPRRHQSARDSFMNELSGGTFHSLRGNPWDESRIGNNMLRRQREGRRWIFDSSYYASRAAHFHSLRSDGRVRRRAPLASKIAFPMAAGVT